MLFHNYTPITSLEWLSTKTKTFFRMNVLFVTWTDVLWPNVRPCYKPNILKMIPCSFLNTQRIVWILIGTIPNRDHIVKGQHL